MGPSTTLEWDGASLWRHFTRMGGRAFPLETWERLAPPPPATWMRLKRALDQVDAWHWPTNSLNPLVMDGSEWSLELRWGQQRWSGRGQNEWPEGFIEVESNLERMFALRALPGFPEAFHFREALGDEVWDFTWDGKTFQWSHVPMGGETRTSGMTLGPGPEMWSGFMEVCYPHTPIEMSFDQGCFAGIEFAIYFPETVGKLSRRAHPYPGFIDPQAAVEALKVLAGQS